MLFIATLTSWEEPLFLLELVYLLKRCSIIKEAGERLDEFLDHFPSVRREQAIAALELAKEMLTAYANPA